MEDQDGGEAVDGFAALFDTHFAFAEDAVGFDAGETLVPEMDGKGEFFFEEGSEFSGFFGGGAVGAAEAEGETDDDFADFVMF